jgi:hypothetical protein
MLIDSTPVQDVQLEFRPYLDWRLRVERRLDRDFFQAAPDDRSDIIWRWRPGVEWTFGKKWSGEVQYQLATDSIRTQTSDTSDDLSDVNLAFIKYKEGKFEVSAGRQKINIGSERLIGSLEWTTAGRAFDGVRVKVGPWDAFAAKVGVSFPKPGRARFAGATYRSSLGLTQVYFKHDGGSPDTDVWTLAQTYEKRAGKWHFETEDAVQFGHAGGRDLRAWAVHGSLNYQVDPKTKLTLEANAASGGGNANTTYTFDNLSPSNHKFYGSMDMQSWRNMEELALAVDHKFNPKWSAKLSWRTLSLRDPSDAWYGAGGGVNRGGIGPFVDPTGGSGRDLGREIDLELTYKHRANITASAGVGFFSPGGFVRARNGGQANQQKWGYLMLQMRF